MTFSNWPSPTDLAAGDRISVLDVASGKQYTVLVERIGNAAGGSPYVSGSCDEWGGGNFSFYYSSQAFAWKRIGRSAPTTLRSIPTESVTQYGATCGKCNEFYEHAEQRPKFVCYGCKVQM